MSFSNQEWIDYYKDKIHICETQIKALRYGILLLDVSESEIALLQWHLKQWIENKNYLKTKLQWHEDRRLEA